MRAWIAAIVIVIAARSAADPVEDEALAHLDRGIAAFDAKDFQLAHRELDAAQGLAPHKPNPYRWLALTEIQLGDCTSAIAHIDAFVARVPPTDARVAEMTRWRELCVSRQSSPQLTGTQALTEPAPRRDDKPLRQRWWFWPVIGTAAVAITGVTVYAVTRSDEAMLPPIRCTSSGCAP